ncbi:AraC family transcriptional regulator [Sphingobacterium sp. PCS056]|uniref:helix-turn-helix domain-containing protein n=1 Tax=Sphingobacterium sp. PCS056 TaxID=2931400 RepID=UPI00200F2BF4|nr:AraC family transcriptional regulator [Sphingobacterium sp. PCS056]UPZ38726.1 AraC family transcriptional regulator [Sphingobacterium sp. PCS056]
MKQLQTGEFYGQTNQTIHLEGITLTDTEYNLDRVDWHYHENPYFTFILQGNVIEGNKKEIYNCAAGSLLFHNWQDPHYNIKPKGFTRGFHIELQNHWFDQLDFNIDNLQGSIKIIDIDIKFLIYNIFKETKLGDTTTSLAIETLVLKTLVKMFDKSYIDADKNPLWVHKIKEILFYECTDRLTLNYLAQTLGMHPVHLSRDFSKYFHCNLGEYLRKLKVEKAYALLAENNLSLTEIAYGCGFSDQSHFNRCFKSISGISPNNFRKMIANKFPSC